MPSSLSSKSVLFQNKCLPLEAQASPHLSFHFASCCHWSSMLRSPPWHFVLHTVEAQSCKHWNMWVQCHFLHHMAQFLYTSGPEISENSEIKVKNFSNFNINNKTSKGYEITNCPYYMQLLYRIPVHYQKLDYLDLFYKRCIKSLLCHGQLILLPILFLNMSLQLCETDYKGTWPALCYALLEICITKTEIYWNINEINHEPFW